MRRLRSSKTIAAPAVRVALEEVPRFGRQVLG